MTVEEINQAISGLDSAGEVSDGYHTFDELYEHRCRLFVVLLNLIGGWKSRKNSDGPQWDGWFVAGMGTPGRDQITYHLPESMWDEVGVPEVEVGRWDGHNSKDVLERLRWLAYYYKGKIITQTP